MENKNQITSLYPVEALECAISIGIAKTPKEKNSIYHFRYQIYVEEILYDLDFADHHNKLLYDEMDDWGVLLYAKVGSELIGTARVNIGHAADFPEELVQNFHMNKFQKFYKRNETSNFAYISKGMIAPAYRNSPVLNLLMNKIYELYCANQVQFAFVNCNLHLIPLYEHYGSRRLVKNFVDQKLGAMTCFVMLVDDIEHLQKVRSPLFHIACKRDSLNTQVVDWFHSEFPEAAKVVNSQLVNEDELWSLLHKRLGRMPNKAMPILQGLSKAEAKKFLHRCATIVRCFAKEQLATYGDVSQELNILLSGKIHCPKISANYTIVPGQQFGANGIGTRSKHLSDIVVVTDMEMLVISYHYFLKFRHAYPDIAYKILQNIKAVELD